MEKAGLELSRFLGGGTSSNANGQHRYDKVGEGLGDFSDTDEFGLTFGNEDSALLLLLPPAL